MSESTQNLSGRALAKARRRAQTQGKAAAVSGQAESSPAPVVEQRTQERVEAVSRETTSARRPPVAPTPVMSSGRQAAMARRQQQVRGEAQKAKPQAMRQPRAKAQPPSPVELTAVAAPASTESAVEMRFSTAKAKSSKVARVTTPSSTESKGRLMSRAYRKAQSQGKTKLNAQKSAGSSMASLARVNNPQASGRDIAKQVRQQRCTQGKTQCSARPTRSTANKSRPEPVSEAPAKVGFAQTGYDQTVSGTLVGESNKMTGLEAGQCRTISGTEYIGPDAYQAKCSYTPSPSPRKVQQTQTAAGMSVSGSVVGRSKKVSGDMAGQCAAITGTEYLPADQSELFCGTKAMPSTPKVSQSQSKRQQTITGPAMGKAERMTGLEAGESAKVSGSQYVGQSGGFSRGPSRVARDSVMGAPTKVAESETAQGSRVTGTHVGLDRAVTGDDAGFCQTVSGMGYQGKETLRTRCQSEPMPMPEKVVASSNFSGLKITGDRAGLGGRITGAEPGRCQRVSGTPYMSLDAVESCEIDAKKLKPDTVKRGAQNAKPISGTQPAPIGLTGSQKGVCGPLTGTPYQGADHSAVMCQMTTAAMEGESDFPQLIVAQPMTKPNVGSSLTGDFSGGQGRVTGDDQQAWMSRASQEEVVLPGRITGDGADSGFSITGDDWGRGDRVTGTEGAWAQGRNVSMKGATTQVVGARDFRPVSAPAVPDSPITGSSGNTKVGAKVTVSGGARA